MSNDSNTPSISGVSDYTGPGNGVSPYKAKRIILIILSVVCLLLSFAPWVSVPALGMVSSFADSIGSSLEIDHSFSVPSLVSMCFDWLANFSSYLDGEIQGSLVVAACAISVIWLGYLIYGIFCLYCFIVGKYDAGKCMWFFIAGTAVAVGVFLVCLFIDLSIQNSLRRSLGDAYYSFGAYIECAGWIWILLIVAAAGIVVSVLAKKDGALEGLGVPQQQNSVVNEAVALQTGVAKTEPNRILQLEKLLEQQKEITNAIEAQLKTAKEELEAKTREEQAQREAQQRKVCPSCRCSNVPTAIFCGHCGHRF